MIRVTSFQKLKLPWRDDLIEKTKRLIPFEWKEIPLKHCPDSRTPVLLPEEKKFLESVSEFYLCDAGGKTYDSSEFYQFCFKFSELHLVVGPAVGWHKDFLSRAKGKISLSSLTFTHALAQVTLAESIYRSACILKNHPFVK